MPVNSKRRFGTVISSSMDIQKRLVALSVITSVVLMLVKFVAYFLTDSNAIFTDAAESIVNVVASSFAFYSIYLSSRPKDENHPYGHGKVEFFSVFVEGGLIFIAGLVILVKSCYSLFVPNQISHLNEGLWLILFTGLVNYGIGFYLVKRGRSLQSMVLEADGKHLQMDAYSTFGLLLGLMIMKITQLPWMDNVISIIMGLFILLNGYKLLRKSIGGLMDESDAEIVEEVVAVLNKFRKPDWIDIHNLRIQRYGNELHIDCHITLPNYYSLNEVHEHLHAVDILINKEIGASTELFIHADPCLPECCSYCNVENCPIRTEEMKNQIIWNSKNITLNMKHFRSSDIDGGDEPK